jgi:hypothetical protein
MKIEIDDDVPPLIVRALEHYASYLKATNRDDSRYQAIAEMFKRKPAQSEEQPEPRRRKSAK